MSLDFTLHILQAREARSIGERAFPGVEAGKFDNNFDYDLSQDSGMSATVLSLDRWINEQPFVEASGDPGEFIDAEVPPYVEVIFNYGGWDTVRPPRAALMAVARILATGPEDVFYIDNGEDLILSRINGHVRKHRQAWWNHFGPFNDIIPDSMTVPNVLGNYADCSAYRNFGARNDGVV